uniref:HYLS1_C domain-containing protein n=1 Tax=Anopheles epiroticus TaxID=199890 RepID=A0A182PJ80_9DIPT
MDASDAKEILNHLNHLGYRNITASQLKEIQKAFFMTIDLKKLILFDATQSTNCGYGDDAVERRNVFERLHTERTASYQAKITKSTEHTHRIAPLDKENRIRPKSSHSVKRSDPVGLYHAYQKDWSKFKQNLPGENNHSELRWKIRNKLLGE